MTKVLIDFNYLDSVSIQSFAIKNDNIKLSARFSSGRMLMFTNQLLTSFIYELVKMLYFSDQIV